MGAKTKLVLADILPRGQNNFDVIRLIAAVGVIFGHSFYLFPAGGHVEPVTQLVQRNFTGTLSVGTFFFLSGILVSQSYARSRSPLRFLLLRAARIYPGLIACLLVEAVVVGPIFTTLGSRDYFAALAPPCYIGTWSLAQPMPFLSACGSLPGLFEGNHIGHPPNGSLWTLYPEVACYLYVLVFGLLGFLNSRLRIGLALAGLFLWHAVAPHSVPYFSDDHYTDVLKVGLFFMAGVAAYALRDTLVLRWQYAVPLMLVAAFVQGTAIQEYALYVALFYLILLAASWSGGAVGLPGDYSFGVYICGWPIQQIVNHEFPALTSYPSNLICIPVALLAGYASWNLVEKPFLKAAHKLARAKTAEVATA